MVSPPQPTEKKNGIPPSQVDLNGTAFSDIVFFFIVYYSNKIELPIKFSTFSPQIDFCTTDSIKS